MKQKVNKQLRNRIKQKMSRTTQEKIAAKLGISQSYVSKILNGEENPKNVNVLLSKINSLISNGFSKN